MHWIHLDPILFWVLKFAGDPFATNDLPMISYMILLFLMHAVWGIVSLNCLKGLNIWSPQIKRFIIFSYQGIIFLSKHSQFQTKPLHVVSRMGYRNIDSSQPNFFPDEQPACFICVGKTLLLILPMESHEAFESWRSSHPQISGPFSRKVKERRARALTPGLPKSPGKAAGDALERWTWMTKERLKQYVVPPLQVDTLR